MFFLPHVRKIGRVTECAGLEIRYTLSGYRGFESLIFRKQNREPFRFPVSVLLLIISCKIFDLIDDVLIFALGLEVETETADGADDATYATTPEESVV